MTTKPNVPANLVEALRGIVRVPVNDGAGTLNGLDYFERTFPASKLAIEAADKIEQLINTLENTMNCLSDQYYGDCEKEIFEAFDLTRKNTD